MLANVMVIWSLDGHTTLETVDLCVQDDLLKRVTTGNSRYDKKVWTRSSFQNEKERRLFAFSV